jgi:hypothetical protein
VRAGLLASYGHRLVDDHRRLVERCLPSQWDELQQQHEQHFRQRAVFRLRLGLGFVERRSQRRFPLLFQVSRGAPAAPTSVAAREQR